MMAPFDYSLDTIESYTLELSTPVDFDAFWQNILRYFKAVHFSQIATAASLFSVALMDHICPPLSVYAAQKYIRIYESNNMKVDRPTKP